MLSWLRSWLYFPLPAEGALVLFVMQLSCPVTATAPQVGGISQSTAVWINAWLLKFKILVFVGMFSFVFVCADVCYCGRISLFTQSESYLHHAGGLKDFFRCSQLIMNQIFLSIIIHVGDVWSLSGKLLNCFSPGLEVKKKKEKAQQDWDSSEVFPRLLPALHMLPTHRTRPAHTAS